MTSFIILAGLALLLWLLVLGVAPTPSTRVTPSGFFLQDGYRFLITLSNDTSVQFWEKQGKPLGVDSGELIAISTMFNNRARTFAFRKLLTFEAAEVKAAYDPNLMSYIIADTGFPQVVTYRWPTNATLCWYGGIQKFMPDELEEGKQPEATVAFPATNWDYTNNVEQLPVYTAAAGTA